MTGEATPAQFGAFVTALRLKGETAEEIAGMAGIMRDKALHVHVDGDLVDTCGNGGDGSRSINVSTIAAFVVAGAGARDVCVAGLERFQDAHEVVEILGV